MSRCWEEEEEWAAGSSWLILPQRGCWEEELEGGARGKIRWRRVPLSWWYFFGSAWWWWSAADGCWMRGGGDRYVRWYKGTYWVAYAWVPPRDGPPEHEFSSMGGLLGPTGAPA